jgi:hypothetical protein
LRLALPDLRSRLPAWARRSEVALLMAPAELSIAVSRPGNTRAATKRFSARLPRRSIVSAVQSGNLREPDVVVFALKQIWNQARLPKRKVGTVTLIIPDQCVRMVAVPLDGPGPGSSEGEAMARWALRDLMPLAIDDYRVDWAILPGEKGSREHGWLFATAAEADLVREYELPVERLGLSVGRVVPVSLAVAASSEPAVDADPDGARLVLCGTGRRPAAIVEAGGVPRMHRAWRGRPRDMDAELRSIESYARQRLGLNIVEALVAGPPRWCTRVAGICEQIGWQTSSTSRWSAHAGATE